jgi:hypothetical protein
MAHQTAVHRAHNPKVAGSNPAPAIEEAPGNPGVFCRHGDLRGRNPKVVDLDSCANGIPAYGSSTYDWDLGHPDHPNPEHRR